MGCAIAEVVPAGAPRRGEGRRGSYLAAGGRRVATPHPRASRATPAPEINGRLKNVSIRTGNRFGKLRGCGGRFPELCTTR